MTIRDSSEASFWPMSRKTLEEHEAAAERMAAARRGDQQHRRVDVGADGSSSEYEAPSANETIGALVEEFTGEATATIEAPPYTPHEELVANEEEAFNSVVAMTHFTPPPASLGPMAELSAQRGRIAAQRMANLEGLNEDKSPVEHLLDDEDLSDDEFDQRFLDAGLDVHAEADPNPNEITPSDQEAFDTFEQELQDGEPE